MSAQDPSAAPIRTCEDYQKMLPAFLDGRLTDARRLLLEDHTRECLSCRRALKQERSRRAAKPAAAKKVGGSRRRPWFARPELGWSLAAAAILVVALVGVAIQGPTTTR